MQRHIIKNNSTMMEHNDELYLRQMVGNRNPFRVPEGYFEQLTGQVMQQLPERGENVALQQPVSQANARKVHLRPWYYAAASIAIAVVMGMGYYFSQDSSASMDAGRIAAVSAVPAATEQVDNSYIDDAADYAMLDNAEIYAYLSENY